MSVWWCDWFQWILQRPISANSQVLHHGRLLGNPQHSQWEARTTMLWVVVETFATPVEMQDAQRNLSSRCITSFQHVQFYAALLQNDFLLTCQWLKEHFCKFFSPFLKHGCVVWVLNGLNTVFVTSAKEVMFLPVFVCLSVCLWVSKITQKVMDGSFWNFEGMSGMAQTTSDSILRWFGRNSGFWITLKFSLAWALRETAIVAMVLASGEQHGVESRFFRSHRTRSV